MAKRSADRVLPWAVPSRWFFLDAADPEVLAAAWRLFLKNHNSPRLELTDVPPLQRFDMAGLLSERAVGAGAVYVREDSPAGEVRWNWPLRVGLLADPASVSLHAALSELIADGQTGWRRNYIQLCEPGRAGPLGCHLLLLPCGLDTSLAALCSATSVVRAACVIVLGAADDSATAGILLDAVRARQP